MNEPSFSAFLHTLNNISPLAPSAWEELMVLVKPSSVLANHQLLRAGSIADRVFFIQNGLLREYYVDRNGKETTRRFNGTGELSGSLADLLSQQPAAVSIETLSACEILEVGWDEVDALSHQHPSLMLLLRRLAEGLYLHKMQREFEMLTLSAAERYQRFVQNSPLLNAQLPRHMVASYLGITPVHLSRIAGADKSPKSRARPPKKT